MTTDPDERKRRYIFRIEPSLIERTDRLAKELYGDNRSLVVRIAIDQFVTEQEKKNGEVKGEAA